MQVVLQSVARKKVLKEKLFLIFCLFLALEVKFSLLVELELVSVVFLHFDEIIQVPVLLDYRIAEVLVTHHVAANDRVRVVLLVVHLAIRVVVLRLSTHLNNCLVVFLIGIVLLAINVECSTP